MSGKSAGSLVGLREGWHWGTFVVTQLGTVAGARIPSCATVHPRLPSLLL